MRLAHDRSGSGPPLLLLHPLGADRRVWDRVAELLRPHREVVAVDLPGFGGSPPLRGVTPTPAALAEAVADHLAALGVAQPDVAGNSLGGWVALELGLRGAARTVVGIAPAGLWPEPLVPKASLGHRAARALGPGAGALARTPRGRARLLAGTVAHPERVPARAAAHLVRAYGRAPGFVAVNDAMRAGRFAALDRIACPVTLVWPDHDRLVERPMSSPERVTNIVLADSGHLPMWDAPAELAEIVLATSERAAAAA